MDIASLSNSGTNSLEATGIRKVSGINQIIQTVVLEFARDPDDLRDLGAGGLQILQTLDINEATGQAQECVARAKLNILRNQQLVPNLSVTETLVDLKMVGSLKSLDTGYEISLQIVTAANESRLISIPIVT